MLTVLQSKEWSYFTGRNWDSEGLRNLINAYGRRQKTPTWKLDLPDFKVCPSISQSCSQKSQLGIMHNELETVSLK